MDIDTVKLDVMRVVKRIGDPLHEHIVEACESYTKEDVTVAVRELVQDGYLRMKDDDIDHDWAYLMTRFGSMEFDRIVEKRGD